LNHNKPHAATTVDNTPANQIKRAYTWNKKKKLPSL